MVRRISTGTALFFVVVSPALGLIGCGSGSSGNNQNSSSDSTALLLTESQATQQDIFADNLVGEATESLAVDVVIPYAPGTVEVSRSCAVNTAGGADLVVHRKATAERVSKNGKHVTTLSRDDVSTQNWIKSITGFPFSCSSADGYVMVPWGSPTDVVGMQLNEKVERTDAIQMDHLKNKGRVNSFRRSSTITGVRTATYGDYQLLGSVATFRKTLNTNVTRTFTRQKLVGNAPMKIQSRITSVASAPLVVSSTVDLTQAPAPWIWKTIESGSLVVDNDIGNHVEAHFHNVKFVRQEGCVPVEGQIEGFITSNHGLVKQTFSIEFLPAEEYGAIVVIGSARIPFERMMTNLCDLDNN